MTLNKEFYVGFFRRRSEEPMFGTGTPETTVTVRAGEYVAPEETVEEDVDPEWEIEVAKVEAMSAEELFRDAAEDVVNGDQCAFDEDDYESAQMWFARAAAVGQLAMYKAFQEMQASKTE